MLLVDGVGVSAGIHFPQLRPSTKPLPASWRVALSGYVLCLGGRLAAAYLLARSVSLLETVLSGGAHCCSFCTPAIEPCCGCGRPTARKACLLYSCSRGCSFQVLSSMVIAAALVNSNTTTAQIGPMFSEGTSTPLSDSQLCERSSRGSSGSAMTSPYRFRWLNAMSWCACQQYGVFDRL